MGIIDDIVSTINGFFNTIDDMFEFAVNPNTEEEQASDVLGDVIEDVQPVDEIAGHLIDASEEFVLSDLEESGHLDPDNVERVMDDVEGGAGGLLGGLMVANSAFEAASLGQLDAHEELVAKAAAIFAFEDVVGRELEARLQAGVDPALEAKARKEHRPRFAALEDFAEANLRSKRVGGNQDPEGYGIPSRIRSLFSDDDFGWMGDMGVYGTRPDQTDLLEFVSLSHLEPEEILEEAPQKGVIPNTAAMQQALELSGQPEDVKNVFEQTLENIPKSADLIQESTRLEGPIFEIDKLVMDGVMSPNMAVNLVKNDIRSYVTVSDADGNPYGDSLSEGEAQNIIIDELRRRWRILDSLPNGVPSFGDIQAWFRRGVISSQEFQNLYQEFGKQESFFYHYLQEQAIQQGADDIQVQHALGRLSSSEANFRLGLIGFSQSEAGAILGGTSPDTIIQERLGRVGGGEALDVTLATEIGSSRGATLRAVGIETLGQLAQLSVEDLTAVTGMTDTEAQTAIQSAQQILEQAQS